MPKIGLVPLTAEVFGEHRDLGRLESFGRRQFYRVQDFQGPCWPR